MERQQQITIQLGSYSNYVGSHFWNYQDDIVRDLYPEEDEVEGDNQIIKYNVEKLYQIRNNQNQNKLSITPRVFILEHR